MAQEITNTCGTDVLMPSVQEEFTLSDNAKTNMTVHPCGSTGTVNLRVVIHFMLKSDGTGNFNEYNDGKVGQPAPGGDPDYHYKWNGYYFAATLVHTANTIMLSNDAIQETRFATCFIPYTLYPTYDKRILYTLQGVYFHRNSTSYNQFMDYSTFYYDNTYAVKKDSCIQVYIFPNSATPSAGGNVWQIPGGDNKMACYLKNYWLGYNVSTGVHWENIIWSPNVAMHKAFNHEILHLLGLHHTDGSPSFPIGIHNDFCFDTPECSNKSEYNTQVNDGLCDTCQKVLTGCQIDRVYTTLNGALLWNSGDTYNRVYKNMNYAKKYIYKCETCGPNIMSINGVTSIPIGSPPYSFFHLNKNGCGEVFMGGGWYGTWFTFANQFIEIFETDMYGSNTVVGNYYSSWTTATSSSYLRNLSALYTFTPNKWYKVKMAVNSSCVGWHESSQWFLYTNPNPCERIAQINDTNTPTSQVYPNPVTDKANLTFVHPVQHIQVIDAMGKVADTFVAENPHFTVWQPDMNLPNGLYFVVSDNRQNSRIKVIVQR